LFFLELCSSFNLLAMAIVVPTILASDPAGYAGRINRVQSFAKRIHIDISDGEFAPVKSVGLAQAYGIEGVELDLHLMINHPESQLENILALKPNLVIVHIEAEGDIKQVLEQCRQLGIKTGVAVLPATTVDHVRDILPLVDHVLVFAGNLGHNGGVMDESCLPKIAAIKAQATVEVGIDGGVNIETGKRAVAAGADVLDVGSFIHDAASPKQAFAQLEAL
jgi:ribulose-phosphate 3-epimerase